MCELLLISRPAKGRRLSWPEHTVGYRRTPPWTPTPVKLTATTIRIIYILSSHEKLSHENLPLFFVCAAYAQSVSDSQVSILLRSVEDSDRGGSTKPINNTSITHIDTGLHTNAIGLELAEFLSPTESAHQSRNSTNFGSAIPRLVKCNAVDSAATDDR